MKLRNKKTGEIRDACEVLDMKEDDGVLYKYYSLAKLNAEWEDYEEPKEWWSIDQFGEPINVSGLNALQLEKLRRIGNLFQTEEEAEKAVEKLKAWKRLKDKGFRFTKWQHDVTEQKYIITMEEKDFEEWVVDSKKADLDLLFGGEE